MGEMLRISFFDVIASENLFERGNPSARGIRRRLFGALSKIVWIATSRVARLAMTFFTKT